MMNQQKSSNDFLSRYDTYLAVGVLLIAILLYSNTFNHGYVLDDHSIILKHSHVQAGTKGIKEILSTNYRHGQQGFNDGLYRPLSLVTFALEEEIFDGKPAISHMINVLLYAISSLLLFLALKQLFRNYPLIIPLSICLIFISHPVHTEIVANIKGRDELLSFLGFSSSLYLFARYFLDADKSKWLIIPALFAFIIALFSKESSVSYAIAIPLFLWMNRDIQNKQIFRTLLFLLPLSIGFILLREYIIGSMSNPVDPGNFGILNNPIAAENNASLKWGSTFALQVLFLKKLFFPFELIHDYSYNQIPLVKLISFSSILGIIILLGLSVYALIGIIKNNIFAGLAALYLLSIVVAAQILRPIGVHFAERLLFFSVLAFSIFIVLIAYNFWSKKVKNKLIVQKRTFVVVLILFSIFSFKSFQRNKDWASNYSLYQADIKNASNSARANYNYGSELSGQAKLNANQQERIKLLQAAAKHLQKATQIYPEYLDAYNNLGIVYKLLGNYKGAIQVYLKNIRIDPNYNKNYYNIATAYYEEKQYNKAINYMQEYVNRDTYNAEAYFIMGQAAGNIKDFQQAINYLNEAIRINPNHIDALNFLGMAYGMMGNYAAVEPSLKKAINLAPGRTDILMNLALSYHQQAKVQEEATTLRQILTIDPNHQLARQQLQLMQ